MGEDNKPTKRAGSISNSTKPSVAPLSAEEKLKRSLKSLGHASGGMGSKSTSSVKLDTSAKDNARKKVGGVVLDVETIEDATKQKFETRGRRNNVIILILSILLVISLVYMSVVMIQYFKSKRDPNCVYTIQGDASKHCEWVVLGGKQTEFVIPDELAPGTAYEVHSSLNINTDREVSITLEVIVTINGEHVVVEGLYNMSDNLIPTNDETANKYVYDGTVSGGGLVFLFEGIDFKDAPIELTSKNVEIKVIANVNFV